jgi:AGCS family alanine or glycine:cation symporter
MSFLAFPDGIRCDKTLCREGVQVLQSQQFRRQFMEAIEKFAAAFAGAVWNLPLVFALFGAGALFTLINRGIQLTMFKHAIEVVMGKFDKPGDKGEISHFQALCAALSATIGLGNIAGVAVAITVGGPGAVFWLWVAGFLGMATKFTEVSLAMMYRETDEEGHVHGGPMYTIKNGLGKAWMPLASIYALFTILSSFGAGNMFQANNLAGALKAGYGVPVWASGIALSAVAGLVLIGGIKRIGTVAGRLVPTMFALYSLGAIGIIVLNASAVPEVFSMIFTGAFNGTAAVGGFAGVAVRQVLVQGVRRACFSNEAGMGSAAMAHSAAKTAEPIREGVVALLEPFVDTIVVCTMTAMVLLITGAWSDTGGLQGAALTAEAFSRVYGKPGAILVDLAVILFAFSTIVSWSYYGEQGTVYLFGLGKVKVYRYVFIGFIMIGSLWKLGPVLDISDAVFGLMAIPNLLVSVLLSKKLAAKTREYIADYRAGKFPKTA